MKKILTITQDIKSSLKLSSDTEKLVQKQTQDFIRCLPTLKKELHFSREKIQQIRNERLRKLLSFAKLNSPWYQKTLAKIDIDNFTEERLIEIPAINKSILMDNWDLFVTNRKLSLALLDKHIEKMSKDGDILYLLNRFHVLATSKTTGKHGVFVYDWNEWTKGYAYFSRYSLYDQNGEKIFPDLSEKIKVAQIIVCSTIYAVYAISKSFNFNHFEKYYLPVTLPMSQIIAELNCIQPAILEGTPSTIYKLCQEASKGNLYIQPKIISLTGEALYKPMRQFMNKIWPNINIFNRYGACEGISANNCRANREEMHLNEDLCIVEPLDENNQPVAKDILASKLYLTNLQYYTLPLIRYEMTDKLRFLNKTCDCGLQYQLIDEPQGRLEFDFIYAGNIFVSHLVFVTPLLFERNILDYQVSQTINGAQIKILINGIVDKDKLILDISAKLTNLGLVKPEVKLLEVKELTYLPSGKLRRYIKME